MKFHQCQLTLPIIFILCITMTQGQVCNDTDLWNNTHGNPCHDYKFNVTNRWWCPNGTYTLDTMRTGGNSYSYPEFNCCACGKGWPVWFVPASGYTASEAVPTVNMNMTNRLMCKDTYRNLTACTMKCKSLPNNLSVTSLATMTSNDFNQSTCVLDLNLENSSVPYIFQIPVSNYLVYLTNWTTNQYNFSCVNNTGVMTSNMLCRYQVDEQPFVSAQCPSNNITNRYIPPDCVDTENWKNPYLNGFTCFEYEIAQRWCANGEFTPGSTWTGGPYYHYPEQNCCACGKGALAINQSTTISTLNNSINASEFGIMTLKNCSVPEISNYIFDIKCLGPLDYIYTNSTMNITLFNCLLNCFFNWNTTQIDKNQSITVSRQSYGSSFVYNLTSNLLSNDQILCQSLIGEIRTPSDFYSTETTSEQVTTTYDGSTYELSTTTATKRSMIKIQALTFVQWRNHV